MLKSKNSISVLIIYGGFFDVANKLKEIEALEQTMSAPGFWDSQESAQKVISQVNQLRTVTGPILQFKKEVEDLEALIELIQDASEDEAAEYLKEVEQSATKFLVKVNELELQSFLSGPLDKNNGIISIHAGAGGTESCDWAEMLLRMYLRWAEIQGFQTEIQDMQAGEEAGISRATFRLIGPNAYGYAKAERGVHRLVRISPFDSNKRRHTSFASVDVIAEIDDDIEIELKDEDLRIDTYRASGSGGQHVNKTDSAIRITHIPSNLVVTCQNERSQHKNKASAMKILKSRLYEKTLDEKRAEMEKYYGPKGEMGWGNQIRSYVFQPYQMVKDLRTGAESGNIQAIMDGNIHPFIEAWLRAGSPTSRNKDIQMEF